MSLQHPDQRANEQRTPAAPSPAEPAAPSALRHITSTRRLLLRRFGLAAVVSGGAVALASCSSDSAGSAGPTTASGAASQSTTSTSPAPAATSARSRTRSSAPAPTGTKVAKADVPVGGGEVLADNYVVTQPQPGVFKAFSKICTHQGCPLSSVTAGQIVCTCHGSHFSITDGSPVSGPAFSQQTGSLPAKQVTVSGSDLYISG